MLWILRPKIKQQAPRPSYRLAPQYDLSGAHRFVFEQETSNPLFLLTATRYVPRQFFSPRAQAPKVLYTYTNTIADLGGTQHGQMFTYPLGRNEG